MPWMRWGIVGLPLVVACSSDVNVGAREHTDTFAQAPSDEVDILFVIDESCSMHQVQESLAGSFSAFAEELERSATDFHLGVISTSFEYDDPDRGRLIGDPPFLTPADDYRAAFPARAQVGIEGADKEKGLEAAAWALSPSMITGPNQGFLRPDAQLLMVYVSDEDDCSDEGALEGLPPEDCYRQRERLVPVSRYVDTLLDLKAEREKVQVGAIVGLEDSACEESFPGRRYHQVADAIGGMTADICEADWTGLLGELGLNATGIRTSFQLTYGAVEESLVVEVDGEVEDPHATRGWSYDPDTWHLHFGEQAIPERGAEITVRYTVDPTARKAELDEAG